MAYVYPNEIKQTEIPIIFEYNNVEENNKQNE